MVTLPHRLQGQAGELNHKTYCKHQTFTNKGSCKANLLIRQMYFIVLAFALIAIASMYMFILYTKGPHNLLCVLFRGGSNCNNCKVKYSLDIVIFTIKSEGH